MFKAKVSLFFKEALYDLNLLSNNKIFDENRFVLK